MIYCGLYLTLSPFYEVNASPRVATRGKALSGPHFVKESAKMRVFPSSLCVHTQIRIIHSGILGIFQA